MPSLRGRNRVAGWLGGALLAVSLAAPAGAQEFINVVPVGEPPETTYVRLAMFSRASLRQPDDRLLATLDAAKSAGATDVALDIWDMGTVPYPNSEYADSDTTFAGRDPLAVLTRGCFDRGLRCWLWPSGGFEVWRTPLNAKIDAGPFLRSRPTWAAVNRDGQVGWEDSLGGVRRYTMTPTVRDVHQFLLKTYLEAIGRYPVAGVLMDNVGLPSLNYSFDGLSNQLFMQQYDPVDPRGLTPADSAEWANWYTFRKSQTRPLVTGFTKNLRKSTNERTVAVVASASPERWDHVEDLPYWTKRAAISWLLVRPTPRTNADLAAALDSTMRELTHSTPTDTRRPPGLGLLLDGSGNDALVRTQVAAMGAVGGRILAAPVEAVVASPERWKSIWTALESMKPEAAAVSKGAEPSRKQAPAKKKTTTRTTRTSKSTAKK